MSPFLLSPPAIRALSLTATSVLLISISFAWARRQQAASPSLKSARGHSSAVFVADCCPCWKQSSQSQRPGSP
jgi:hypothetical protein